MRKKRLIVSLLIVVILVCAMPVTAFATNYIYDGDHPVTDFRGVQFVPYKTVTPIPANTVCETLIVWYGTRMDKGKLIHQYQFYFCKNDQLIYDSTTGRYSTTVTVPVAELNYNLDEKDPVFYSGHWVGFAEYPQKVAYTMSGNYKISSPNMNYEEFVITNPNVSFPSTPAPTPSPPPDPPLPPDPPDPPIPPDPPAPPAPPMVIPPHDPDMVPWDGDKINGFFEYVSAAIGHIVNVGIVYFGIILAVYVMIRIIKTFENSSAGGGG